MAKRKKQQVELWQDAQPTKQKRPDTYRPIEFLAPLGAGAVLIPPAMLSHWWWGGDPVATPVACLGIASISGALTYAAHRLSWARTWYAHLQLTAGTALTGAWLTSATILGPFERPLLDLYILGVAGMGGLSTIHKLASNGGYVPERAGARRLPSWDQVKQVLGIKGSEQVIVEENDNITKSQILLEPGRQTYDDLAGEAERIAGYYGLPRDAVQMVRNPDNASIVEMLVVTRDMLKEARTWPGLHAPGQSIADAPVILGHYQDGALLEQELVNHHILTVGQTGAGKSVYAKMKVVDVGSRRDTFVLAIDTQKGRQTLGPVLPAIGWAAFTKPEAKALIEALGRAVYARADYLAERGLEQWEPDCGLSFLYLLFEEASSMISDMDSFTELMKVARSAGIHIEASLQRATATNVDTDARANFGSSMCFGVRDSADAGFALPGYVIDAGAHPDDWGQRRPGYCYAALDNVDEERHSMAARTYYATNQALLHAALSSAHLRAPLDPITEAAFGDAYANRTIYEVPAQLLAEVTGGREVGPARFVQPPVVSAPARPATDREDDDMLTATDDEFDLALPVNHEPELDHITHETDLGDEEEGEFRLTPKKGSRESAAEARARLDAQLQLWIDQGITEFSPVELRTALRDSQGLERSKAWCFKELNRLEEEGRIERTEDGKARIIYQSHTPEGRTLAAV